MHPNGCINSLILLLLLLLRYKLLLLHKPGQADATAVHLVNKCFLMQAPLNTWMHILAPCHLFSYILIKFSFHVLVLRVSFQGLPAVLFIMTFAESSSSPSSSREPDLQLKRLSAFFYAGDVVSLCACIFFHSVCVFVCVFVWVLVCVCVFLCLPVSAL